MMTKIVSAALEPLILKLICENRKAARTLVKQRP